MTPPDRTYELPLGRDRIEDILPHRPPFLFVDVITELEPGKRVVGYLDLPPDLWIYEGHFPGYPVTPGVILLEAIAQVGAVAVLTAEEHAGKIPLFAGADKVRFKREVKPGERAVFEVEITRMRGPVGWGVGRVTVDDEVAATGEVIFAVKAPD